jgi:formyltetrahydrofolate deformylase
METERYILTLSCKDRIGIVSSVTLHLTSIQGFILDSQQYADLETGSFFMRVEFKADGPRFPSNLDDLKAGFRALSESLCLELELVCADHPPKLLIAVSKASHCLNDLLHRWHTGNLPVEIAGIVSNHPDLAQLAGWYQVPFHHLPVSPGSKEAQERKMLAVFEQTGSDFLILARYMQVLSPWMAEQLAGHCINIHHSFLPGFKGARPYARARERGVKLIGATAHFVTSDLDEGPIIEQAVERVDHRASEADLIRIGRDTEAVVLARAVRWAAEKRLFISGARTVVFR